MVNKLTILNMMNVTGVEFLANVKPEKNTPIKQTPLTYHGTKREVNYGSSNPRVSRGTVKPH